MLSVFPELLNYHLVGVTIIRVAVGLILLYIGMMTISTKRALYTSEMQMKNYPLSNLIPWIFGIVQIITGGFLILGFLTQVMALVSAYLFINLIFIEKYVGKVLNQCPLFHIIMIVISISLLFIAPGLYAIDLPL